MADTELSATQLATVKQYMRVGGTENDPVIESLYLAAGLYLGGAGIEKPQATHALYNLAVWSLTLHYYDHRDDVGSESGFPSGLRPIINQLKLIGTGACIEITLDADELAAVKKYMGVDGDDDDIIEALYMAAIVYLANAGIKKPQATHALYNLAVWSLTLHYYDHRDAVATENSFPIGLRPVINQLKLTAMGG